MKIPRAAFPPWGCVAYRQPSRLLPGVVVQNIMSAAVDGKKGIFWRRQNQGS